MEEPQVEKEKKTTSATTTADDPTRTASYGGGPRLSDMKVRDLIAINTRLVEVPYTASLSHTMNALVANRVIAAPVSAPPGHWIGAGGSMIVETDEQSGVVRKHYIGMVTMLDILAHIGGDDQMNGGGDDLSDLHKKMSVPVSSIIGQCLEGLSLWTFNPNTRLTCSILDCMEIFSKGIHRALVPIDCQTENISGAELVESAPGYRMLTQMDLMKFLKENASDLQGILQRSLEEIGAISETVYAISHSTKVIDAIKCMRAALLNAVPIVVDSNSLEEESKQLIDGKGKKLIGTFSATDLRGCHLATLQTWLRLSALEFTEQVANSPLFANLNAPNVSPRELVACHPDSSLSEVIDKVVAKHVHRIWVVDRHGSLGGLVSLSDIIRVMRAYLLLYPHVA